MKTEKLRAFSLALCWLFLCATTTVARADGGMSITEIMYDPAGTDTNREWVEIYNGSSSDADISKYSFLTDGVPSTHHALTAQGSSIVPAGSYAVIVQNPASFKIDYPAYAGLMFDSSWSGLTATSGKTLALLDDQGNILDQVTYDPSIGADNDGNSLEKTAEGTWIAAAPTPGAANASVSAGDTNSGGDDAGGTNGSTSDTGNGLPANDNPSAGSLTKEETHMKASLAAPKNATSGVPISVWSKVIGYYSEEREYGVFHYAFGDGSAVDARSPNALAHTYLFPGSYVISLEYRSSDYPKDPEVVTQETIDVAAPSVAISAVDDDGSIELANTSKLAADVSGWSLEMPGVSPSGTFVIPSGTIILAGKTITLAQPMLGFTADSTSLLDLLLPSGTVASTYAGASDQLAPAENMKISSAVRAKKDTASVTKKKSVSKKKTTNKTTEPVLGANVLGAADAAPSTRPNPSSSSPLIPILLGIAGIIVGSIIGIRRLPVFSKNSSKDEDTASGEPSTQAVADKIRIIEE